MWDSGCSRLQVRRMCCFLLRHCHMSIVFDRLLNHSSKVCLRMHCCIVFRMQPRSLRYQVRGFRNSQNRLDFQLDPIIFCLCLSCSQQNLKFVCMIQQIHGLLDQRLHMKLSEYFLVE